MTMADDSSVPGCEQDSALINRKVSMVFNLEVIEIVDDDYPLFTLRAFQPIFDSFHGFLGVLFGLERKFGLFRDVAIACFEGLVGVSVNPKNIDFFSVFLIAVVNSYTCFARRD